MQLCHSCCWTHTLIFYKMSALIEGQYFEIEFNISPTKLIWAQWVNETSLVTLIEILLNVVYSLQTVLWIAMQSAYIRYCNGHPSRLQLPTGNKMKVIRFHILTICTFNDAHVGKVPSYRVPLLINRRQKSFPME